MDKTTEIYRKILLPIYWAFLSYMLLRPSLEGSEKWILFPGVDKVVHFFIFLALGVAFRLAFPKQSKLTYFQILFSYALLTEILQGTMVLGRSLEVLDIIADTAGFMLALLVYKRVGDLTSKIIN